MTFLNQPYPDSEDFKSTIFGSLSAGLVVFLVLMALMPFGLNELPLTEATSMNLVFGFITIIVSVIYELFVQHILKLNREDETWTLWKWCIYVLVLVTLIALTNYGFIRSYFSPGNHWITLFGVMYNTFVVAAFPILLFGSLNMIRQLKKNQNVALHFSKEKDQPNNYAIIALPIKDSEKTLEVDPNKILYIEAMQNYVTIISVIEGEVTKQIHRNTLSNVALALSDTDIKQSHRSFLVNTAIVSSVSGNAQGLKLKLEKLEGITIPVSRKYIPYFKRN